MMDADRYQELAMRTAGDLAATPFRDALVVSALGLSGESGEVADMVKKHVAQGHPLDRERLIIEAGDVAWYLARLCTALDISLGEVLQRNIDKLIARYPDGFSPEASINRKEHA